MTLVEREVTWDTVMKVDEDHEMTLVVGYTVVPTAVDGLPKFDGT